MFSAESRTLQNRTRRRIFGHEDLVLDPVHEEAGVLPVVRVDGVSQRNQLDGLTLKRETKHVFRLVDRARGRVLPVGRYLLQDAAGGAEAVQVFVDQFLRNVTDLLVGETLDGVNLSQQMSTA